MNSPLKQARLSRDETLEQVSAAVGIDTGNLSRIERGKQVPSKELTEKLVKYFDGAVTEVQIIFPERFMEPDPAPAEPEPPAAKYTGPERRTGLVDLHQVLPKQRASNGVENHSSDVTPE